MLDGRRRKELNGEAGREEREGGEGAKKKKHTSAPTPVPAITEGTEPVRINPVNPPPAVKRARRKASAERWSCGFEREGVPYD